MKNILKNENSKKAKKQKLQVNDFLSNIDNEIETINDKIDSIIKCIEKKSSSKKSKKNG